MKFCFGDIVVVEGNLLGVVVKSWINMLGEKSYEVYVRMHYEIREYREENIQRYMVRPKYLSEDEMYYQNEMMRGSW